MAVTNKDICKTCEDLQQHRLHTGKLGRQLNVGP